MTRRRLHWPSRTLVSLLAALTTWVTLLSWSGLAERPSSYLVPLFFGCLLIAAVGILCRGLRLPAGVVLLVQVLVVLLWLQARWTSGTTVAGVLPTTESMAEVRATVDAGVQAARAYAAPVPGSAAPFGALMLLAGLATALLVDLLATGLRKVPLAGLPLLAAYTAPVSVLLESVSWAGFAAAAGCFVALLAADEADRLSGWGRQVGAAHQVFDSRSVQDSGTGGALWSSARKIGATATGLAVLVPVLVPTLSTGLFDGTGPGSGDGDGVTLSNPILNLRRDLTRGADVDLVRIVTPERNPGYLRLSVLDLFDGESWRPSGRDIPVTQRAEGLLPRPPGLDAAVARTRVPYRITVAPSFTSEWLPTPYPAFSVEAAGDWRYDRSTLDFFAVADGLTAAGLDYELEALDVRPTVEQLANAGPAPASVSVPNTALPQELPSRVRQLARTVTDGLPTKLQKAARLQEWFRVDGGFTYSLDRAPGTGLDTLVQFIDDGPGGRVGYCEQFAAAMAVMGRAIGIPSRVAVGFLRPAPAGPDTYVYSSHDLHAWPEMYFDGVGWIRFEPTPQARTGASLPGYTTATVPTDEPSSATSGPSARPTLPDRLERTPGPAPGAGADGPGGRTGDLLAGGLFGALVVLLLASPRLLRSALRERRWARARGPVDAAEAGWAELRDTAHDLAVGWDERLTVRRQAVALTRAFGPPDDAPDALARPATRGADADPRAVEALDRVVQQVERARYARRPQPHPAHGSTAADGVADLRGDVERCVAALRAGASKRQRTRATWFPASLARRWTAGSRSRYPGTVGTAGVDRAG